MDQRKRARIPYGYTIKNGEAVISPEESGQLLKYYELFLSGLSMAEAAREAGLPYSQKALPNLLSRKEYLGTDFYPPLVKEEYQRKLILEWEARKGENPRQPKERKQKRVRIYTDFYFENVATQVANTVEYLTALYLGIKPKVNHL